MIRVTLEMWPQGDESRRYSLGHLNIINDGTSLDPKRGNYVSRFFGKDGAWLRSRDSSTSNWPRKSKPVLSLLKRMLEEAGF